MMRDLILALLVSMQVTYENKYASFEWYYSYRYLFDICEEAKLRRIATGLLRQYSALTKSWSQERNSQWVCRHYFATKMILNATSLLNSMEFAEEAGLRTTTSYLAYYSLLSVLRALACTLPSEAWNNGTLVKLTHNKAVSLGIDRVSIFNKDRGQELRRVCRTLQAQREAVSYNASLSLQAQPIDDTKIIETVTLIAEIAQFNSELLERSVDKHVADEQFAVMEEYVHQIACVDIHGFLLLDDDDYKRLGYLARKQPAPCNLALLMTAGQVEDFMAKWEGAPDVDGTFSNGSPADWQTVFDVP